MSQQEHADADAQGQVQFLNRRPKKQKHKQRQGQRVEAHEDDVEGKEPFNLLSALPSELQTLVLARTYGNSAIWQV